MISTLRRVSRTILRGQSAEGLLLIAVSLGSVLLFTSGVQPGDRATFGLNLGISQAVSLPDLVLPVRLTIYLIGLIIAFLGGREIARGLRQPQAPRRTRQWLGLAILLLRQVSRGVINHSNGIRMATGPDPRGSRDPRPAPR